MEKITSPNQLVYLYTRHERHLALGMIDSGHEGLSSDNFWQVREQCRINNGTYTPVHIDGDDKMRFLHISVDDPAKVSYTKDADKGRQDLQTRTTLAAYCEKFGLDISTANTPSRRVSGVDGSMRLSDVGENLSSLDTPTPRPATIREKLGMIQDLIDEVLADLG